MQNLHGVKICTVVQPRELIIAQLSHDRIARAIKFEECLKPAKGSTLPRPSRLRSIYDPPISYPREAIP